MSKDYGEKRQAPTIKDVASHAGVAIGTVGRYLNKLPIREGSREPIEKAIAALGFRKNSSASAIKTNRSRLVAFLVPEFDEFHSALMQRLMTHLKRRGLVMLIYYHSQDRGSFEEAIHHFIEHRVDALVASGSIPEGTSLAELKNHQIPLVVYDCRIDLLAADEVLVSNAQSMQHAVSHLIDCGHRDIAIITGDLQHYTAKERLRGYIEAMSDGGLLTNDEYIQGGNWTKGVGYASMQALMALPKKPSAVIISSYVLAIGALTFLRERGIKVPTDVSIISFDDVSAFQLFDTSISTISQPVEEIADSIASLLFSRILEGQDRQSRSIMLPCTLQLRDSVSRPPTKGDTINI